MTVATHDLTAADHRSNRVGRKHKNKPVGAFDCGIDSLATKVPSGEYPPSPPQASQNSTLSWFSPQPAHKVLAPARVGNENVRHLFIDVLSMSFDFGSDSFSMQLLSAHLGVRCNCLLRHYSLEAFALHFAIELRKSILTLVHEINIQSYLRSQAWALMLTFKRKTGVLTSLE